MPEEKVASVGDVKPATQHRVKFKLRFQHGFGKLECLHYVSIVSDMKRDGVGIVYVHRDQSGLIKKVIQQK